MMIKRSTLFILLILVSGMTFLVTSFTVGYALTDVRIDNEKKANISEITYLLRIAKPLHTGDYDEAKRQLCDLLLRHAFNIGKLKKNSHFGEREEANRSLTRIGSFYESHGGYLDSYFTVDARRYIEEAKKELDGEY
jgi:hypothetical protein